MSSKGPTLGRPCAVFLVVALWLGCASIDMNSTQPADETGDTDTNANQGVDSEPDMNADTDADTDTDTNTDTDTDTDTDTNTDVIEAAIPCTLETASEVCGEIVFCVDGYCCDTPCEGLCEACNLPSLEGTCTPELPGVICRSATDLCDAPETCDGSKPTCPVDTKKANGDICREAAGLCDEPETCDGINVTCPTDLKKPLGETCRSVAGLCDLEAEQCDGTNPTCPEDALRANTYECRVSKGDCDPAEQCDGITGTCPDDVKSIALCRPSAGLCDVEEYCNGSDNDCPPNELASITVQCNTSPYAPATEYQCSPAGCGGTPEELPYYQYCNGTDTFCPTDNLVVGSWQERDLCLEDELCDISTVDETSYCAVCPQGCVGSTCNQCDTGDCCNDSTHRYKDTNTQCSDTAEPGHTELGCSGGCAGQPQQRDYYRYCKGDSPDCDDSNLKPQGWTSNGSPCATDQPCVSGICQSSCANGCNDNACCTCLASDPCCNDSNCEITGSGEPCGSPIDVAECTSTCGTARIGTQTPQCNGTTTTCDGMSEPSWTLETLCTATHICSTNGTTTANCNLCDNPPGVDYCSGGDAYQYDYPGTCVTSACDYGLTVEDCAEGCDGGICTGGCVDALVVIPNDFNTNDGSYTVTVLPPGDGSSYNEIWQWKTSARAPNSPTAHGKVWGTGMDDDEWHYNCDNTFLTSPEYDLSVCDGETIELSFDAWYSYYEDSYETHHDGFTIEFWNGSAWVQEEPEEGWDLVSPLSFSGTSCTGGTPYVYGKYVFTKNMFFPDLFDWETKHFVLSWASYPTTFKFRFVHGSDEYNQKFGAYIDNVTVEVQP